MVCGPRSLRRSAERPPHVSWPDCRQPGPRHCALERRSGRPWPSRHDAQSRLIQLIAAARTRMPGGVGGGSRKTSPCPDPRRGRRQQTAEALGTAANGPADERSAAAARTSGGCSTSPALPPPAVMPPSEPSASGSKRPGRQVGEGSDHRQGSPALDRPQRHARGWNRRSTRNREPGVDARHPRQSDPGSQPWSRWRRGRRGASSKPRRQPQQTSHAAEPRSESRPKGLADHSCRQTRDGSERVC